MSKKTKIILATLVLVLIAAAAATAYFFYFRSEKPSKEQKEEQEKTVTLGSLKPITTAIEDTTKKKVAVLGPAGGVLETQFADGAKAYLVFPPESLLIPTEISLAPLNKVPLEGFPTQEIIYGVSIGPSDAGGSPQRDSFLVIDMRKDKSLPDGKEARLSPCRFEFKTFNPILCASEKNLPLDFGVEEGKIVFGFDYRYGNVENRYTYPIGEPDVAVSRINNYGAFFYVKAGSALSQKLAEFTLEHSNNYENRLASVAQLAAINKVSQKAKDFVSELDDRVSFSRREALQTANIAIFLGLKELASKNLGKFDRDFGSDASGVRAYGYTWGEYSALARLYNLSLKDKKFSAAAKLSPLPKQDDPRLLSGIKKAFSQIDILSWDEVSFAGLALMETNRGKLTFKKTTGWHFVKPAYAYTVTDIPEVDQESAELEALIKVAFEEAGKSCEYDELYPLTRWALEERFDDDLASIGFGKITECLKKDVENAKTKGEALAAARHAFQNDEGEIASAALDKAETLPEADCDLVKKDLSNFGMNECQ